MDLRTHHKRLSVRASVGLISTKKVKSPPGTLLCTYALVLVRCSLEEDRTSVHQAHSRLASPLTEPCDFVHQSPHLSVWCMDEANRSDELSAPHDAVALGCWNRGLAGVLRASGSSTADVSRGPL